MQSLEALQKKINSADDLLSIVKTMKALAAANMRQYERAVRSLADYNRTIEMGLQVVLNKEKDMMKKPSVAKGSSLAVIFGSDYGFTGQFNEEIVRYAVEDMKEEDGENWIIMAVGVQANNRLERVGQEVAESFGVPNSLVAVTKMVERVLLAMEKRREQQGVERVSLYYNEPLSGASFTPIKTILLPVDLGSIGEKKEWPSRTIPTFSLEPERIIPALIRQYIFVNIYRAFVLSMASENASRLVSMQAAAKKIEELLEDIRAEFRQNRQNVITAEILDIVGGFEAIVK